MRENNMRRFAARQLADLSPETLRQIRTMIDEQLKAEPSPALARQHVTAPAVTAGAFPYPGLPYFARSRPHGIVTADAPLRSRSALRPPHKASFQPLPHRFEKTLPTRPVHLLRGTRSITPRNLGSSV